MRNTYKVITLGLIFAGLAAISPAAFAASSPDTYMPNSALFFQFNASKPQPFQGKLRTLFDSAFPESSNNPLSQKLFTANLEDTTIGFSQNIHLTSGKELYLMGFALDSYTFQKIIEAESSLDMTTENLGLGRILYTLDENTFFTYKNGNVILSNDRGLIHDQLFANSTDTLSQNADWQNFLSQIDPNSFFTGYLNFDKLPSSADVPKISSWLTSEAFAISQGTDSLSGKLLINFKPASGWNTDKYLFTPAIYKQVNSSNLIFYQESNNLSDRFQDMQNMFNKSGDGFNELPQMISSLLEMNTGISAETDLAPLFRHRYAFTVHNDTANTDATMPAFSLLAEVKGQETQAQAILDKIQAVVETMLKNALESYTLTDIAFGNSTLKQLTITSSEPKFVFTLSYGVTRDGILVFTTFKNPENLISDSGLVSDNAWKNTYTGQQLMDISILNFSNLQTFLDKAMAGNGISQDIDKILAPLHYLGTYTTGKANTVMANFTINLDLTKLDTYQSAFTDLFNAFNIDPSTVTDRYQDSYPLFSDVQTEDWYKPYVEGVYRTGIMMGYGDEFRPNQAITRAEFVKTLIIAADFEGRSLRQTDTDKHFSDVDPSAWYFIYINEALSNGFISGYADGTFHPNSPITRAEAMQMLVKSDVDWFGAYSGQELGRPFHDVQSSDWFFAPVYKVFDARLVSGKSYDTFAPGMALTRAETAKILSLKLGLY